MLDYALTEKNEQVGNKGLDELTCNVDAWAVIHTFRYVKKLLAAMILFILTTGTHWRYSLAVRVLTLHEYPVCAFYTGDGCLQSRFVQINATG